MREGQGNLEREGSIGKPGQGGGQYQQDQVRD